MVLLPGHPDRKPALAGEIEVVVGSLALGTRIDLKLSRDFLSRLPILLTL